MTPTPITVKAEIEVPLERIVNCIIGAIEGGSNYWLNSFVAHKDSADLRARLKAVDKIWYAEEQFWTEGGKADLEFDKPDDKSDGTATVTLTALTNGLTIMANTAPRHFADLMSENDDAITHDVFIQCVLFGEIVFG